MRTVAIIQARTGSARLPRKVLMDLAGQPMLAHVVSRARAARTIDDVVVATSILDSDDAIEACAAEAGAAVFRGDEQDVLARYAGAARAFEADIVVRLTADCPLLDPAVIDRVVDTLRHDARACDYVSNVVERTYPRGLDTEAFFADTLERLDRRAQSAAAREHVTYHLLRERPDLFVIGSVVDDVDNSDLRWTVDEPADLELVQRVMADGPTASYPALVAWLRERPDLLAVNAHVQQKA